MKRQPKIIPGTLREVSEEEATREALKWFKPTLTEEEQAQELQFWLERTAKSAAWRLVQNRLADLKRDAKGELKWVIERRAVRAWEAAVGAKFDHARGKYLAMCSLK